ncbi:hypothetical protein [Actinomadura oligospora]|uniref:hypothetical protein n=1 Tax=Actinomadura oligospora TaxID=111804 RepID=UPI00047E38EA|nr:hypothetical protein [Actinomadura oligospora]
MKRITKLAMGAFAGAAVALAPLALTGTANADTGTNPETTVITLKQDAGTRTHAAGSQVIHCALAARNPHHSHHADAANRGMVNAVGSVKCDHAVARISIRVGLYKHGRLYRQSPVKANAGKTSVTQNAARRCVARQDYTGVAIADVTAPPGYRPSHAKGRSIGKTVRIAACKRGG